MRILIFSWRGPGHPNAGGAERATHEHAREWAKAGHNVTLFTSFYQGARKKESVDGVEIIRRGNELGGVHLAAYRWYSSLKEKPDLVIDQFHGFPFFTPLYVQVKKLAFIHEVAKEVWWMNHLSFPTRYIYGTVGFFTEPWIFQLLYQNIPFMTVSESTKKDLINWGIPQENITVIYNGVRVIRPNPMPQKEKKPTFIFLGPLTRDKGIEDGIKAFSLIAKKLENAQFWVVGKGDPKMTKFLISKVQKMGLGGKIKFWGYVDEKKKFELLARAHALINPSVREGWGLVNIEANSVGIPVVAYDVAGCRDSVRNGETGFLVKRGELESMASKILELVSDVKLYKRVQRKALLWSKKFKWEKATKESLKLINALMTS